MFLQKKSEKKICAGIDIGTHSIKLIESTYLEGKYTVTNFAIKEIPSNPTENTLFDTLKALLNEVNLTTKVLRISLSSPNAVVRFINMPAMSHQDLKDSLRYEADKYIPFSVDEVNMDFCILDKPPGAQGQMHVLVAVAKKDLITKRSKMFNDLGFDVSLIDINAFAVFNAFCASKKDLDKEENSALLNIGHSYTNIVIAKGDVPYFTRDIQIGGGYIAKEVAGQLGVEAEKIFRPDTGMQDKTQEISKGIQGALVKLGEEIKLSFGYYENQFGGSMDKIYLSGGLSYVNELSSYFEEHTGIKPVIWDPLGHFTIAGSVDRKGLDEARYLLAVVSGLVIRENV